MRCVALKTAVSGYLRLSSSAESYVKDWVVTDKHRNGGTSRIWGAVQSLCVLAAVVYQECAHSDRLLAFVLGLEKDR